MSKPPTVHRVYNESLSGVFGEFGSGADAHAFYLQAAMSPAELDNIDLVSDIPGSEQWPIRALFQRDIDTARVTDGLIPYLRDTSQVRFFNPLTLTLLPMDEDGHTILAEMPAITGGRQSLDGREWRTLERPDFYRFRWTDDAAQYGVLEWNTQRSRLVAIDGQHRLFGLKRLWDDPLPKSDFLKWRIPVVVVSFRGDEGGATAPSVLDTVRSIFVSINTNAQEVNETREILLSDNSINALCTQELIESSHSNDKKPPDDRESKKLPLIFFDWRGEEHRGLTVRSHAALKTSVEIRDWFKRYLLGDDLKPEQKAAMEVMPTDPLHEAFLRGRLTHRDTKEVRSWVRISLLPSLEHLLTTFAPYERYLRELRRIELDTQYPGRPDLARHAFDQLRFGSNRANELLQGDVREALNSIKNEIDRAKEQHLDRLIREDIGLRGIAWAFGALRNRFSGPPEWLRYSGLFTAALNRADDDGWLTLDRRTKYGKFLRHIVEDHAGTTVNYRVESARSALGTHVALIVAAYGMPWPEEWKFSWSAFLEDRLSTWTWTVERGYRRQFKGILKDKYPEGGAPLTQAVNREATKGARKQARQLRAAIARIVEGRSTEGPVPREMEGDS